MLEARPPIHLHLLHHLHSNLPYFLFPASIELLVPKFSTLHLPSIHISHGISDMPPSIHPSIHPSIYMRRASTVQWHTLAVLSRSSYPLNGPLLLLSYTCNQKVPSHLGPMTLLTPALSSPSSLNHSYLLAFQGDCALLKSQVTERR